MTHPHSPSPLIAPRLAFAMLPLLGLLIAAVGLIAFHQLQETTSRLRTERLAYALYELRRVVESSLAYGLPLEVTDNLAPLMTAALDRDLSVLSIDLYDRNGRLVLSTDRFGIGESVPPEWLATQAADADGLWQLTERGAGVIGISIINTFGQTVGGLALRHRLAQDTMDNRGESGRLAIAVAALVPLLLVLAWLAFHRALKPAESQGGTLVKAVAGGLAPPEAAETALAHQTAGFIDRMAAAETAMAEASDAIRRIDAEE